MGTFAENFIEKYRVYPNPLCVGLDPHVDLIPHGFRSGSMEYDDPQTVQVVYDFLSSVIDLCVDKVHVVKPQSAFFEQLGWRGCECLEKISQYAKDKGLLVILDAKRGDVGSTAVAYARAYLSEGSPFDALTINPYMGIDTIVPFWEMSKKTGKGVFVLVKTSNEGAGDFQDQLVGGRKLYRTVASEIEGLSWQSGEVREWGAIGAVVGSTYPSEAMEIRKDLPNSLFLIPGYGMQGGGAESSVAGFIDKRKGLLLEGGIISSSRAVLFPASTGNSIGCWRESVSRVLSKSSFELVEAVSNKG